MANVQNVGFANTTYAADQAAIERQKQMAAILQQQALQQDGGTQVIGGFAVPQSGFAPLAKALQGMAAGGAQRKAAASEQALADKSRTDLSSVLMGAFGRPEIAQPSAELGGGPGAPAVAGADPQTQARLLLSHPQTAPLGMNLIQQQQQRAERERLLASILGPQGGSQAPAGVAPGTAAATGAPWAQAPQGAPAQSGPTDAQIAALLASGDPAAKALAEFFQKQNTPTVNRGYGVGVMRNGQYVPDPASITQALEMERGKQGITAPMEPPISLKTSSGQEIQLSRPEYAEYQRSGNLPFRYSGQPGQAPQPGAVPGSTPRPSAGGGGLGVIGATQTEEEATRQAAIRTANTEAAKQFIKEQSDNYAKLRDVPATLKNIDRVKTLAAGQARNFMGPFGPAKLEITKFFRSNVPGMGSLNLDGVRNAEEMKSALFNQVMDNLKKMDSQPSQYQQQVMQEAFGTLTTDPTSVPRIMDVFGDILRNRVTIHNETVSSAEKRGTRFPYSVNVNLPPRSFTNEAAARAAKLKDGEKVIINGRTATWRNE